MHPVGRDFAFSVLVAVILVALIFGAWWLVRVIRAKRSRRPFSYQQRDWRNEWKP